VENAKLREEVVFLEGKMGDMEKEMEILAQKRDTFLDYYLGFVVTHLCCDVLGLCLNMIGGSRDFFYVW
jgi:hypothetical protein